MDKTEQKTKVKNPASLTIRRDATDKRPADEMIADALMGTGVAGNSRVIRSLHNDREVLDIDACVKILETAAKKVGEGDFSVIDSFLMSQAVSLDIMFTSMVLRANRCTTIQGMESYMKLALKAQQQSRLTLETLVKNKNPRQTVITKQANISNGPQQVNNTLNQGGEPHLLKFEKFRNRAKQTIEEP